MPDAPIKSEEFLKILSGLGGHVSQDWEIQENDTITRTQAVKYIIDAAGYEKIAGMPDIFITDFADNSELKREDVSQLQEAWDLCRAMRHCSDRTMK